MTWQQLRTCRACDEPKPLEAFALVRNRDQRPTRRRVCKECRPLDNAAHTRAWRARRKVAA